MGADKKPLSKEYKVCPAPEKAAATGGRAARGSALLICMPHSGQEAVSGGRVFLTERAAGAKALRLAWLSDHAAKCPHLSKRAPVVVTPAFQELSSPIKKYL